jgi:hypothetical protein
VKVECLAYALTHPALAGVWGGTDDAQRRRLRRAMAPTPTTRRPRRVEPRTADRLRTDEYRVISGLVDAGADALGVSAEALLGPGQSRPLCHYRQAVMFAARLLTNASYPTLGRAFGRDSSTVIHACRQAEALYPEMVEVVLEVFEASSRAAGGGVRAP